MVRAAYHGDEIEYNARGLVVDLPMMQAPAARTRATDGASMVPALPDSGFDPNVHGAPSIEIKSFTEIGSPCNGPKSSPAITAFSQAFAAARAISGVVLTNALMVGSRAS